MAETPSDTERGEKPFKRLAFFLREAVAVSTWLIVFIKLFIYDVDLLFVNRVPWLQRVYPYKFFIIIGFVAIVWVSLGTKRFLKIVGYVAVYPLVLLLWRLPKTFIKNWALLLMFAPAIESAIVTLKWRFVFAALTMLSALGICLSQDAQVLTVLMALLLIYLLIHYIFRLRVAFRPTSLFANLAKPMGEMWRTTIKTYKTAEYQARSGPSANPAEYPKKHMDSLKNLYINNLLSTYVATKVDEAVSSRRTDLYFIVALIYSFVLTVTIFGFEYFGLAKIDPASFQNAETASFWSFLLFSFNVILHTPYSKISPLSNLALALANLETGASLIIGLFFVFILFTSSRERYRQELKAVSTQIMASAFKVEKYLEKDLRMRLIDAESKIIEHDPTFPDMMRFLGRQPPATVSESDQAPDQTLPPGGSL